MMMIVICGLQQDKAALAAVEVTRFYVGALDGLREMALRIHLT